LKILQEGLPRRENSASNDKEAENGSEENEIISEKV